MNAGKYLRYVQPCVLVVSRRSAFEAIFCFSRQLTRSFAVASPLWFARALRTCTLSVATSHRPTSGGGCGISSLSVSLSPSVCLPPRIISLAHHFCGRIWSLVIKTVYTYAWDIYMDWDLGQLPPRWFSKGSVWRCGSTNELADSKDELDPLLAQQAMGRNIMSQKGEGTAKSLQISQTRRTFLRSCVPSASSRTPHCTTGPWRRTSSVV